MPVLVLAVLLAGCAGTGGSWVAQTPRPSTAEPVADCIDPHEQAGAGIGLRTPEGLQADTLVFGTGRTGIVYANMSEGDLCQWYPTALVMARAGYRTAVFNYSAGAPDTDLLTVAAELRRRGVTRIALVGASKGGTAVLCAAGRTPVAAVVALSAPDSYQGLDALTAIGRVRAPTWLGVGEFDTDFVPSTRRLFAAGRAGVKHLEVVPSSGHGTALLISADVEQQVNAFLRTNAPA